MSKKLHNPHDTFVKNLLSHPDSAAAFLQKALPPNLLQLCILEKLVQIPTSYTTPDLDKLISDIVLKVPLEGEKVNITISVLVEHKSRVDHLTSIQLLSYIANGYDLQRKRKETFSVIVPVIYYHGKGSWKFQPLHQMFKNIPDCLVPYIPHPAQYAHRRYLRFDQPFSKGGASIDKRRELTQSYSRGGPMCPTSHERGQYFRLG